VFQIQITAVVQVDARDSLSQLPMTTYQKLDMFQETAINILQGMENAEMNQLLKLLQFLALSSLRRMIQMS